MNLVLRRNLTKPNQEVHIAVATFSEEIAPCFGAARRFRLTSPKRRVSLGAEPEVYPIDLTAVQVCPVCTRPVKLAVCCGAHAWQVETELREFNRVTRNVYNARLFINYGSPVSKERCRELDIELLTPDSVPRAQSSGVIGTTLPPLRERIDGHPNLNVMKTRKKRNDLASH